LIGDHGKEHVMRLLQFVDSIPNAKARFGVQALAWLERNTASLVYGANLAPKGRLRKAQGVSPGKKHINNGSPERAKQFAPI
jgi:hypothetical protein